jgi:hypothetical protein
MHVMLISLPTIRNVAVCVLLFTLGTLAYATASYACRHVSDFICGEVANQFARGAVMLIHGD